MAERGECGCVTHNGRFVTVCEQHRDPEGRKILLEMKRQMDTKDARIAELEAEVELQRRWLREVADLASGRIPLRGEDPPMTTLRECPECEGSGRLHRDDYSPMRDGCETCHDEGWVRDRLLYDHRCPACRSCDTCDGEGKVNDEEWERYMEENVR